MRKPHCVGVEYPKAEQDAQQEAMRAWLNEMIGVQTRTSRYFHYVDPPERMWFDNGHYASEGMIRRRVRRQIYWFLSEEDALLFIMAWGGEYSHEGSDREEIVRFTRETPLKRK